MVEGEDFYHDAKTVGGLEKASSPTITKPRWCRLPFFRSERTRRHLRDIVRVECSSVRRQVWVDPVAYAGTRGMEVDQKLSVHNQVHRIREWMEVLPLVLQKPVSNALPDHTVSTYPAAGTVAHPFWHRSS